MPKDVLDEREFELINIIGARLGSNQRALSSQMDMSLGMVNMLIRRMISKGYIRIEQLNKRKVQYILTPKGFSEKMRKSIRYTLKTINSIGLIKNRAKEVLNGLIQKGHRHFLILGESDFSHLVELALRELGGDFTISHVKEIPGDHFDGLLLICQEVPDNQNLVENPNIFNLVEELAKDYDMNQVKMGDG